MELEYTCQKCGMEATTLYKSLTDGLWLCEVCSEERDLEEPIYNKEEK